MHVHFALHGMVAVLIGIAVGKARLETTSCQTNSETIRIVIAPGTLILRVRSSPKFTAPPYNGIIQ